MMKFQSFLLILVSFTYFAVCNGQVNNLSQFVNIFLEPSTKLFDVSDPKLNLKANGIVVGIDIDGTYNTICVDHDGSFPQIAKMICNRLGYNGDRPSYVLISSSGKNLKYPTKYRIKSCDAKDCKLERTTLRNCVNHKQDLHVFCPNEYTFKSNEICQKNTSCTLKKGLSGELTIVQGAKKYLMCGRRRNFNQKEAKLFCGLLGEPTNYSRIVESIRYKGKKIGGFSKMSCPDHVKDLSECTDKEPNDKEGCTPSDSIGVLCSGINTLAPVKVPKLSCNASWVKVVWDDKQITKENFQIIYPNKKICKDVVKTMSGSLRVIEMRLNKCGMTRNGDKKDALEYGFLARRTFFQDGLVIKSEELFSMTCRLPRPTYNRTESIKIVGSQINPGGGIIDLPSELTLYSDSSFKNKLRSVNDFAVGSKVFVLVSFVNPPSNILLILLNCRIIIDQYEYALIKDKCPNSKRGVEIIPQTHDSMGFSFYSFTRYGADAKVTCDTTKCVKNDPGCDQTCTK